MDGKLDGWKEISAFLNRPVRTLQRWRNKRGLPVFGAHDGPRSPVIAFKTDLRNWLRRSLLRADDSEETSPELQLRNSVDIPESVDTRLSHQLLRRYYPDKALRASGLFRFSFSVNGQRVSTNIATKGEWLGLKISIDERDHDRFPLHALSVSWPSTSVHEEAELREELNKRGTMFYNKPIYCLRAFAPHQKQVAVFSLGQYGDYKIQLGRLEEETTNALRNSDNKPDVAFYMRRARMQLRNRLLPDCSTVSTFRRLCAGGTNVLLALRKPDHDGFAFFVKRRSKRVSTGRQLFSLLPSGMHQPTNKANARFETSIAATVYRETYEELFGGQEVEVEDQHIAPQWFMSKAPLRWISEHRDKVVTEIVSFGINLVDGTYEFGVLVVIDDENYWSMFQDAMTPNREFDDSETPYFSTMDSDRLFMLLTDPYLADTSSIALVEGLRRLNVLCPARTKLPRLKLLLNTSL